jgi:PKD repeat protein
MGNNYSGELGNGTYNDSDIPEMIVSSNVTAIASGGYHSLFLKSDGSLWAMGYNGFGQLGDGTTDNGNFETNLPEMIVPSNVTAIAAGVEHSLFLKSDGSLWAMGYNGFGQLGDGTYNETDVPEMIVSSNVTAIAAGGYHSLFLKSDGSLWAMGYNRFGQLGAGPYEYLTDIPQEIVPFFPTVSFYASPTNGQAPLNVVLTAPNVDNFSYPITAWNWSFGDGTTSTNQNPTHTFMSNGIYQASLIATNNAGDMVTGSGPAIYVGPLPFIMTQPQSQFVTNGDQAGFGVGFSGIPPFYYQWQLNGSNLTDDGNIFGSTNGALLLNTTSTNDGGSYTVIITDAYGSVTSSVAVLTLILPSYGVTDLGSLGGGTGAYALVSSY